VEQEEQVKRISLAEQFSTRSLWLEKVKERIVNILPCSSGPAS
jgi:hypothetical protein